MPCTRCLKWIVARQPTARPVLAAAACIVLTSLATLIASRQALSADHYALAFATAPTAVRVSPDGRELLIEFPGALPNGEADRVAKSLGPLLEGYAEGYGAVRYRLTEPSRAELNPASGTRVVVVTPQSQPEATDDDRRQLALVQARTAAKNGDLGAARVRLLDLAATRPGDLEPLLTLAELETSAGSWQHAIGLYNRVGGLFPEATDVFRDRDALARTHGPAFRIDGGATFGADGERAQTATVLGSMPLGERWRANVSLQTSHDETRGLRLPFSSSSTTYSGTKVLGDVGAVYDWGKPLGSTSLDLFAAPRTLGGALKHEFSTRFGDTTLGALYHQPYWGTVMAFAADARRDQIGVSQAMTLPDLWQAQLGAGLIRYGIPGYDSVAAGPSLLAGLSKGLPARWMPLDGMQIRVGYRLEAEYLSRTATALTGGLPLPLLDVRTREFHSLYAETSAPLGPGRASALLGYAVDRYGGSGPLATLRYASGDDSDRLAFGAEAGIEPSLDVKTRTLFHLGGHLVWRFGGN